MDKNSIKKYAIWAREELIKRVSTKAEEYEIRANDELVDNIETISNRVLTGTEKKQRTALIRIVKDKGFEQAMEEASYTWFNRFIALRFMEVNGYLPSKVRVFTDDENNFKPQILDEAIHMELDGLDLEKVLDLKEQNKNDELYKYLIITQCNALHSVLPKMFPKIDDYTQLLFPDNILRDGSAIEQMIAIIPEEDFKDAVQILGWLYQFYNTDPKSVVDKQKAKISKEQIPAATQLFTPDWIVRYMVENSLGRLWVERNPNQELKSNWKYYLDEAEQTEEVQAKLDEIRKNPINLKEIKIIDPCMGSGHILVYAFDVLVQIYESQGYSSRDAVVSILQNNLYGLDLDERAYQLSYFALMMKARSYDRRFLTKKIDPQVYCPIGYADGEEYGSLVEVNELEEMPKLPEELTLFDLDYDFKLNIWNFRRLLNQKYDVVVTNPPYKGSSDLNATLGEFVKKKYPDSKSDLFAVFIERCLHLSNKDGYVAMVTMHSWMFLSSYEKLRARLLHTDIINMAHLGAKAFEEISGEVVQTTAWVMKKSNLQSYKGTYARLVDFNSQDSKEEAFLEYGNLYAATQENFSKIPGSPIAYWVSERMLEAYNDKIKLLKDIASPRAGLATGDNTIFQRLWFEVDISNIGFGFKNTEETINSENKWYPCNSGGEFRKWSTNDEYVVNWKNNGFELKNFRNANGKIASRPQNTQYYFKNGITWNKLSSSRFAVKYKRIGYVFDDTSRSAFIDEEDNLLYLTGLLCSNTVFEFLKALNPTMSFTNGDLEKIPFIEATDNKVIIDNLVYQNIFFSKTDWDSFETSWDFVKHPLLNYGVSLSSGLGDDYSHSIDFKVEKDKNRFLVIEKDKPKNITMQSAYELWEEHCQSQFNTLKANEEELNRIFIDIYGLQDELTPEVEDKDVTVRLADKTRDVKSFISYAVGCMFGRYSLDVDGLVYAGGLFSDQWVVISGQYYGREVVEKYVSDELQRVDSLAEIYEFSCGDLQASEVSSERGNVCTIGSNEESRSFNSFQYRRGTTKELYKGIQTISINSKWIESRTGNATYDLCSAEILNAITNRNCDELMSRGWENAKLINWEVIHSKIVCSEQCLVDSSSNSTHLPLPTSHYGVDIDNVIPICDDEYFEDDIVGRFVDFVKLVYGTETLEQNLDFIAGALGGKGTSRDVIRNYFLNGFYTDHCKVYSKRPIYWQLESGKKNGFKALIYMHRYQPNTMARVRTDYVHEQQGRYRTAITDLECRIALASTSERVKLNKQLTKLKDQDTEIRVFEEKVHHKADQMIKIDLDDGVKHNYAIFGDILTKIK